MSQAEQGNVWDRTGVYIVIAALVAGGAFLCVLMTQQLMTRNFAELALRSRAEKGDVHAQLALGKAYQEGTLGLKKDDTEALAWITRAAASGKPGSAEAQGYLCYMYLIAYHAPEDLPKAAANCEPAAKAGDSVGIRLWGYMHLEGLGVTRDYSIAYIWLGQSAARGDAAGERLFAYLYYNGFGTRRDYVTAADWYEKAATGGDAFADYMLGDIYYHGQGRPRDPTEALQFTRRAADEGIIDAQMRMAWSYRTGDGVAKDEVQERGWLQKAAGRGYLPAQCRLAMLHFDEGDAFVDDRQATRWLQGSKQQDQLECMNDDAWRLATTSDAASRDPAKAEAWAAKTLALAPDQAAYLDTMAAVYAAQGRFDQAAAEQQRAISRLPTTPDYAAELQGMQSRLALYQQRRPYYDPDMSPAPPVATKNL